MFISSQLMFNLKATHKPVKAYYEALATFHLHGHTTEGNTRSAFADLLKRCAISIDKRSGIVNDPNREDDDRYILKLIGQIITISLGTIKIVNSLPPPNLAD